MAFRYKPRKEEEIEKRANRQGGDFTGFINKDLPVYAAREGENWIRFMPPSDNWETETGGQPGYGYDVHVHYGIGPDNGAVLCNNKMLGQKCPICEERVRAERAGNEELAKELRITQRVLVMLIDRKDEDKGPQFWAMPWTVERDINKISRDKQSGTYFYIDDPDEGYDVTFDKTGKGVATKYSGFQIARRPTSVDEVHLDFVSEWPLPEVLIHRTYSEVKTIFEGGDAPEEEEAPKKSPRRAAREEEEAPRRRRAEPEEEAPRRRATARDEEPVRRRAREEEEAPPRRSSRREPEPEVEEEEDEDDEEEAPPARRSRRDPEPEPAPRRARAAEEPVRRRSKTEEDLEDDIPFDRETGEVKGGKPVRRTIREPAPAASPQAERSARLREVYKNRGAR